MAPGRIGRSSSGRAGSDPGLTRSDPGLTPQHHAAGEHRHRDHDQRDQLPRVLIVPHQDQFGGGADESEEQDPEEQPSQAASVAPGTSVGMLGLAGARELADQLRSIRSGSRCGEVSGVQSRKRATVRRNSILFDDSADDRKRRAEEQLRSASLEFMTVDSNLDRIERRIETEIVTARGRPRATTVERHRRWRPASAGRSPELETYTSDRPDSAELYAIQRESGDSCTCSIGSFACVSRLRSATRMAAPTRPGPPLDRKTSDRSIGGPVLQPDDRQLVARQEHRRICAGRIDANDARRVCPVLRANAMSPAARSADRCR